MVWPAIGRWNWNWDPWSDLGRLRDQMDEAVGSWTGRVGREYPAVNIWTGENDAVITAELPGVEAKDLDISVQGETVTLRGKRQTEQPGQGQVYHRQERGAGSFIRTMQLPFEIDADNVEAHLEQGLLRVQLQRSQKDQPRKIPVKSA